MQTASDTTAKTNLEIDRATNSIRFTRRFHASRAAVFQAWTVPQEVTQWWDAGGDPLVSCDIDLRPGGSFKFVTRSYPDRPFTGTYQTIIAPELLVFDAGGAIGRVRLEEANGETDMIVEIDCKSPQLLEQYIQMGIHTGTVQTISNLAAYLKA